MDNEKNDQQTPSPSTDGITKPVVNSDILAANTIIEPTSESVRTPQPAMPDTMPTQTAPIQGAAPITNEQLAQTTKFHLPDAQNMSAKHRRTINRKTILIGLGVLTLATAAIIGLSMTRKDAPQEAAPVTQTETKTAAALTATINGVEGTIDVSADAEEWKEAEDGAALSDLDYLRTDKESRATILFSEDSVLRLNTSTTIQIRTLTDDTISVAVLGGEVYSHLADDASRTFTVTTTGDSFTAKGTIFRTVNSEQLEGVEVFEGEVATSDNTAVTEGMGYYHKNSANTAIESTVVELNKSALIKDDFISWNVKEDAAKTNFTTSGFLDDLEAPIITVVSPTAITLETEEKSITITGTVSEATATLLVNEQVVKLDSAGAFATTVDLKMGKNTIVLVTKDSKDNSSKKTITVTRVEEKKAEVTYMTLEGSQGSTGINLSWSLKAGVEATDGYKVVYSATKSPTYKGVGVVDQTADDEITVIPKEDGKTYFVRICVYKASNDTCTKYSNEVKVVAPKAS